MGIVQLGVILGENFSDRSYPRSEFSLVRVVQVGIVWWESPGWQLFGWEFSCYQYGISGNLLQLLKSSLKNRKQRVELNGEAFFS